MITPKHWARAIVDENGSETDDESGFTGIGWSDISEQEAHANALKRARRIQANVAQGDWLTHQDLEDAYYHNNVLREPVINELHNDHGARLAVVTRNIYGAYVLNAAGAMFIDIDLPPERKAYQRRPAEPGFFARLFGRGTPPEPDPVVEKPKSPADKIRDIVATYPGMGLKLYRTPNGLRGLVTDRTYTPGSDEAQAILKAFGSDELYTRLCQAQQCFRARLTPKPWRISMDLPPRNFPFTNPRKQAVYDRWSAGYESRSQDYAACEPVSDEIIGNTTVHPDIVPVMALHDELACAAGKALA